MTSLFSFAFVSIPAFLLSYFVAKYLSRRMKDAGITGKDVHKKDMPEVAEMGGLSVFFSLFPILGLSILFSDPPDIRVAASIVTLILVGLVGIYDDLRGLNHRLKPTLVVLASIPVIYSLIGRTSVDIPIAGKLSVGLLYPLVAVPLAVTTSSNFTNILAGLNGLETGIGFLGTATVSLCALLKGESSIALLGFGVSSAFLGLMLLNWYPASIFPGDTGTLLSGASIAVIGLTAGVEFAAIVVSIPAAIDFSLKMQNRNPFKQRSSFGDTKIMEVGTLSPPPYPSLSHAFMVVSPIKESSLVKMLLLTEFLYCVIAVAVQLFMLG